jgi:hypothetical protein
MSGKPTSISKSSNQAHSTPSVLFLPPDRAVTNQLAQQTCDALAQRGDPHFASEDVVDGLARFLGTVARLTAKSLTHQNASWLNGQYSKEKRHVA